MAKSSVSLVIVESPAKARTIARFLGDGYVVESSIGHIRDLPKRAGDVPDEYKQLKWSRLGVDVDNGFKPLYVIDPEKKTHIKHLKQLLKKSEALLLATDEDREGESIAWHLLRVLDPKVPVKRMVFHEITRKAIEKAIEEPREIDQNLVDAQEARRILDRLYGYEVSPVLWKKVMPKLSAGRVQSVATRIIVERERERMRFQSSVYWDLEAQLDKAGAEPGAMVATMVGLDGQRLATGKDFDDSGKLKKTGLVCLDETAAISIAEEIRGKKLRVDAIERKPYRRSPPAPFMTSTLQQEAGRKLKFSAARAMRAAQRLYESGHITYMRTDSTTLAEVAVSAARRQIEQLYGKENLPKTPRVYKRKVKNAQEAHEAIRPAGESFKMPQDLAGDLGPDEAKLYELIWKRTIASQMEDAQGESVQVKLSCESNSGKQVDFSLRGNTVLFPGFFRAYVEGSDDPAAELENRERHLPALNEGEELAVTEVTPLRHETQPPARFTEASLVRRLEELGVGRPSTYASIISTIQARGYVWKKASALIPSFKAFAVVTLLEKHFGHLVDYAFTAKMEDELDSIAQGQENTQSWLHRFYFGPQKAANDGGQQSVGLHDMVAQQLEAIDARAINTIPLGVNASGQEIAVRVGRYGPYLQRGEDTVSIPDDLPPDQLDVEKAEQLLAAPSSERELGKDPESGLPIFLKAGRFGPYVQVGEMEAEQKPKTASLLSSMSVDSVTYEDALKLLSLPREVGKHPEDGEPILAMNGRYGPYIAKGADKRSLEREEQLFSLTLDEAVHILAQPKQHRRRAAAEPLKELGADPVSGKTITLRKGRYGHYVTDGETNASLRTGDDPESILPERAQELLQIRREKGPGKKKSKKKASTKKSNTSKASKTGSKKKSATKKKPLAKKSAAKKTTAKKTGSKESAVKKK